MRTRTAFPDSFFPDTNPSLIIFLQARGEGGAHHLSLHGDAKLHSSHAAGLPVSGTHSPRATCLLRSDHGHHGIELGVVLGQGEPHQGSAGVPQAGSSRSILSQLRAGQEVGPACAWALWKIS